VPGPQVQHLRQPARQPPVRQLRFDVVWRRLDQRRPLDLGRIVAEAGYADQAHLVRDFRQFTGTTPTRFLARTLSRGGVTEDVRQVPG
jgi:AraC-like DNA-binding protein